MKQGDKEQMHNEELLVLELQVAKEAEMLPKRHLLKLHEIHRVAGWKGEEQINSQLLFCRKYRLTVTRANHWKQRMQYNYKSE